MEYDGLKLYDLSEAQELYVYLMKFSLYKNIANIPFCLLLKQEVDWNLMQEAYRIEVQRNDSLRMRFLKTKEGVKQYFLPEVKLPDVEFKDFTGCSEESMKDWLNKKAVRSLKFYKGELYEVAFFKTPDGQSGIYFCVFHMAMDTYAMILFLKDLVDVYAALANETEMPAPLSKFEDSLQRDLDYVGTPREEKDIAFFKEYWESMPPIMYCGIDGGRELERLRKKKKDPDYRFASIFAMFKNKTRLITRHVDQETTDRWVNFADENKISYQTLVHLGMHFALSVLNDCVEQTCFTFTENRRTKLDDLKCGGDRVHGHNIVTIIPKEMVIKDALNKVSVDQMKQFRHADCSSTKALAFAAMNQKFGQTETITALTYSLLPPGSVSTPEGFDCDLIILDAGRFLTSCMHTIFPNLRKGGMDYTYKNYTSQFTKEDIDHFHDLFLKAVETIIANPEAIANDVYSVLLDA